MSDNYDELAEWAETSDIGPDARITKASGPGAGRDLVLDLSGGVEWAVVDYTAAALNAARSEDPRRRGARKTELWAMYSREEAEDFLPSLLDQGHDARVVTRTVTDWKEPG